MSIRRGDDYQMGTKWYKFDETKGSRQKRPTIKKYVLVRCRSNRELFPDPVILGYMKNSAGDKQSPQFITPGGNAGKPYEWCDCLPDDFEYKN